MDTNKLISSTFVQARVVDGRCFDSSLIKFLKKSAEIGLDIPQVITNIFDEAIVYNNADAPFDGTLSAFSMLIWDELKLRRPIGKSILDILVTATLERMDIYALIDSLETARELNKRKRVDTRMHRGRYPSMLESSGVTAKSTEDLFVIRFPLRRDRRNSDRI